MVGAGASFHGDRLWRQLVHDFRKLRAADLS